MIIVYKYIDIPAYYENLNKNIFSEQLNIALNQPDLLIHFRAIYKEDISLFYRLRDEMILRGIIFKEEYQNNFFPALPYKIQHIISVEENEQNYKKLNQEATGMQALINYHLINSDLFFNNIPLEGVAHFLKKDASFLARFFERAGFAIFPVNEISKIVSPQIANDYVKEEPIEIYVHLKEKDNSHELEKNYLIKEWFDGGEFLAFHRYCEEQGKKTFFELDIDFIEKFKHVKGIGAAKYNSAIKRYKEFPTVAMKRESQKETKKITALEFFTNNSFKSLLEKSQVDYLEFIDSIYHADEKDIYSSVPLEVFEEKGAYLLELLKTFKEEEEQKEFTTLQFQIKTHSNYKFIKGFTKRNIHRIFQLKISEGIDENIHLFEMVEDRNYHKELKVLLSNIEHYDPPHIEIKKIKEMFSAREWNVVIERLEKTLQEVGESMGVTRERVRQIEGKINNKLRNRVKSLHIDLYFSYYLESNISLSIDELMSHLQIDSEFKDIFIVLIDRDENLERKGQRLINKRLYDYASKIKELIREENETIIESTDVISKFNEGSDYEFKLEVIDYFLKEIGYKRKNALYFKQSIKFPDQIAYLFKRKILNPIEMTDENFAYLQELMQEVFDEQFVNGKRAAVARIRDTKNVILVAGNTFMYEDLDEVSHELLDEIQYAVDASLEKHHMVTASDIYQEYLSKWVKYNIQSHYHLYSILQYHFSDLYVIGKGNTLGIFKSENAKISIETLLVDHLRKNGGVLSKKQILNEFKWESYKLEQVLARSNHLITVDEEGIEGSAVKLISALNLTDSNIERIKNVLSDFLSNGYFFTTDLLLEMEFDDELSEILAEANISDTSTLGSLLKWIDPDLRGYQHLFFKKESTVDSIEKVLIEQFPDIVRRDEIENFLVEKGYSASSVFSVIGQLLENKSFYIYTAYQFINAQQICFSDEVKESLKQYLQKSLENKTYLSAFDLKGYTSDILAVSSREWQPQLIAELSPLIGFKHIRTTSDYRYNKWILIPENSNISSYEQLVYQVITTEYQGNYHEQDLAAFLETKKLSHSPYRLSLELKESDYFEMTELGFVKVKEYANGIN